MARIGKAVTHGRLSRPPPDTRDSVVVVSESVFDPGQHGVHTAFIEQTRALAELGVEVRVNDLGACGATLTLVHSAGPLGLAALRRAGPNGIAFAHVTPATLSGSIRGEPVWGDLARRYLTHFYRCAAAVVALSSTNRDELLEMSVPPDRIRLIPGGIHPDRVTRSVPSALLSDIRANRSRSRMLVIGVGQLQHRKGIETFAEVAREVREHDFVWVGGCPFGRLTAGGPRCAERLMSNAPNVRFVGSVSDELLRAYYGAADAFFLPSHQENFGHAVVEAATAGLPLVLSDIPPFREHFAEGATLAARPRMSAAVRRSLAAGNYRQRQQAAAKRLARRFTARLAAADLLTLAGNGRAKTLPG